MGREFPWFPQDGKFPKLGNFPGIPVREIPGREKFEAIREGGNGNFPLNITVPRLNCVVSRNLSGICVGVASRGWCCCTPLATWLPWRQARVLVWRGQRSVQPLHLLVGQNSSTNTRMCSNLQAWLQSATLCTESNLNLAHSHHTDGNIAFPQQNW